MFPVCEPGRQRIIFMGKELKNDGQVSGDLFVNDIFIVVTADNELQLIVEAKLDDSKVVQVFLRAAPA